MNSITRDHTRAYKENQAVFQSALAASTIVNHRDSAEFDAFFTTDGKKAVTWPKVYKALLALDDLQKCVLKYLIDPVFEHCVVPLEDSDSDTEPATCRGGSAVITGKKALMEVTMETCPKWIRHSRANPQSFSTSNSLDAATESVVQRWSRLDLTKT